MIYSDNTYDITNNIATYVRREFKSVFDTASSKWYMLNNLNNYEEYGLYGNSFDTYYTGKLVIVNNREYEWNGTEWVDLGEYVEQVVAVYRDSSHTGNIKFPQYIRNITSFSATFKSIQSGGGVFLGSNGSSDSNDWRMFFYQNLMYYDCGNGRTNNSQIKINNTYNLLFSGNPMKLTNITTGAAIYTGTSTRPSSGDYNFCFGGVDEYGSGGSSTDYGYLYDLVFYSDNDGQNAIAHYIPKIQNDTIGMYDTINDVFVAATGTIGAENGSVRPKDYSEKAAPTISSLWASTIYRNSAHLTTLMRNDAEMTKIDYMSDDILKKGEAPLPIDYLCFEANTAGSTIALSNTNISPNIEYSRDKNTWTTWDYSALTLQNVGDKIYMRGSNPNGIGLTETNVSKFIMTGSISVKGNIMTLIDKVGETLVIPSNYCFRNLFRQCTSLVEANISLPATTLTNGCYDNIFRDCSNLEIGPTELPAVNIPDAAYRSFFGSCSKLANAPIFYGVTLGIGSYVNVLGDCVLINKVISYAQNISANNCLTKWLNNVSATGDFYNLGGANYPSGASGIPSGWTVHTSL